MESGEVYASLGLGVTGVLIATGVFIYLMEFQSNPKDKQR